VLLARCSRAYQWTAQNCAGALSEWGYDDTMTVIHSLPPRRTTKGAFRFLADIN